MSDDVTMSWCAGFLDAEGSFIISPIKIRGIPRYKPFISCNQLMSSEPLARLKLSLGGSILVRKKRTKSGKLHWQWQITSAVMAKAAITALLPLLTRKREDALILLSFCENVSSKGVKPTYEQLREQLRCFSELKILRNFGKHCT